MFSPQGDDNTASSEDINASQSQAQQEAVGEASERSTPEKMDASENEKPRERTIYTQHQLQVMETKFTQQSFLDRQE